MKRQSWIMISVIILLLIVIGTSVVRNGFSTGNVISEENLTLDGQAKIITVPEAPKPEEFAPSSFQVKIVNFAYLPTTVEINAGDTVIWENRDSVGHTITSDDGVEMNSRLLMNGERYSHRFNIIGEYSYYCTSHPYMTGKVVVK